MLNLLNWQELSRAKQPVSGYSKRPQSSPPTPPTFRLPFSQIEHEEDAAKHILPWLLLQGKERSTSLLSASLVDEDQQVKAAVETSPAPVA